MAFTDARGEGESEGGGFLDICTRSVWKEWRAEMRMVGEGEGRDRTVE